MSALPVTYMNQKNAWVDSHIFRTWFHKIFIPTVREKLKNMDLQPNALLLLTIVLLTLMKLKSQMMACTCSCQGFTSY